MFALTLINQKSTEQQPKEQKAKSFLQRKYNFEVIGHRGARGLAPENTLAAFEKAIEIGVNTLEMDVVLTKNKKVLVSHEAWMSAKICVHKNKAIEPEQEQKHNIYKMKYAKTQEYDCGSLIHPDFDEQENEKTTKPLLKDVLQMASALSRNHGTSIQYLIEIKSSPDGDFIFHPDPKEFVNVVLNELEAYADLKHVCLQSFDWRILNEIKNKNPEVKVALLTYDISLENALDKLKFIPEIYAPHFKQINKNLVSLAKANGMHIFAWTVNEIEDMHDVLQLGVDGIITDYPNRAIKLKRNLKF